MKKVISILLLSIILIHLIGFYAYFVVRLGHIRQEMRESIASLPAEELQIFVLTRDEYGKLRVNDHEIKVDGKMYDHSKPQWDGDSVTLYAKHDEAEDNLWDFLNEVVDTAAKDDKAAPGQLINYLTLIFLPIQSISLSAVSLEKSALDLRQYRLLSESLSIESPPPRKIVFTS